MIDEYVKNHTEKEIVAYISTNLKSQTTAMVEAIKNQNMYSLTIDVAAIIQLSTMMSALDKKMNGAKSKIL